MLGDVDRRRRRCSQLDRGWPGGSRRARAARARARAVRLPARRSTTTSPRSSSCGCASRRAQLATARCSTPSAGDVRPDAAGSRSSATGPGLLILDGLLAVDTCVADRTVDRAAREPATCCSRSDARPDEMVERDDGLARAVHRPAWRCSTPSSPSACAPWPQIAAGAAPPRRAARRRARRAARDLLPAAARGAPGAGAVAPGGRWGRVEPGGIRLALPLTHRLLGQLVGRRAAVDLARAAAARARRDSSPARPATGTSTATVRRSTCELLIERDRRA